MSPPASAKVPCVGRQVVSGEKIGIIKLQKKMRWITNAFFLKYLVASI